MQHNDMIYNDLIVKINKLHITPRINFSNIILNEKANC